ncbi:MAG: DNA alkylation repair protein [Clostridiales bacterium]|nr:DNA alkylation repair protein [Clostridiales bacterium]
MQKIKDLLLENQDLEYKTFHQKLMPTIENERVIGVRIPKIKEIVKRVKDSPFSLDFIKEKHYYYEENNVHGGLLEYLPKTKEELFLMIEEFLPYIDNWATCDFTVSNLKRVKKLKKEFFERIKVWIKSDKPYTVRFAIVLLLTYYKEELTEEIYKLVNSVKLEDYYVNMGVAWFYSVALVYDYERVKEILESKILKPFIQNKSISKGIDSFRLTKEQKEYLKTLKK